MFPDGPPSAPPDPADPPVDPEAIHGLARVLVPLASALAVIGSSSAGDADADSAGPPTRTDEEVLLTAARAYERRAARLWEALVQVGPPAEDLARRGTQNTGRVGRGATSPRSILRRAATFWGEIEHRIDMAMRLYARGREAMDGGSGPFRRLTIERKVLDLAKLRVLLGRPGAPGYVAGWLDYMDQLHDGRNQAVERFLVRERRLTASAETIRSAHPEFAARVELARSAQEALHRLLDRFERAAAARR
jgi:hypothetical protein